MKALAVNNNATNRSLVTALLKALGLPQGSGVGWDFAVAILRHAVTCADSYRIALLDMRLPGVDGKQLGRRIAADPLLNRTLRALGLEI
jgi:two-component system, sensor histidine kinase and response regulator